jgi:3-hydroxyisobutyrate dehydrogenase-like beta-hydroxyacid dehydrogenase
MLSTTSPSEARHLADLCCTHGAAMLDGGMIGSVTSDEGDARVMTIGGSRIDVDHAMPVLEQAARAVIHCGAVGSAFSAKVAWSAACLGRWAAVDEATSIAAAGGVDAERFLEVLTEVDGGNDESLALLNSDCRAHGAHRQALLGLDSSGLLEAAHRLAADVGRDAPIAAASRSRFGRADGGSHDQRSVQRSTPARVDNVIDFVERSNHKRRREISAIPPHRMGRS